MSSRDDSNAGLPTLHFAAGDLKAAMLLCIAYDGALRAAGLSASDRPPTGSRTREVAESAEKADGVAFHMIDVVLSGLKAQPTYLAITKSLGECALTLEDVFEAVKRLRTPEGRAASMRDRMQTRIRQLTGDESALEVLPPRRRRMGV